MKLPGDVTSLLSAWVDGDALALEQLMPLVYNELHRIERIHWSRQPDGHTLQPTALIHEAFLKLVDSGGRPFENRSHFFAVASTAMRQVLVNHAKANQTQKRGKRLERGLTLSDAEFIVQKEARDVLLLNDALDLLEKIDARKKKVVELRYFGGLSTDEIAEALKISSVTVSRDWSFARAWLARELGGEARRPVCKSRDQPFGFGPDNGAPAVPRRDGRQSRNQFVGRLLFAFAGGSQIRLDRLAQD